MKKILLIDDDQINHFITARQIEILNKKIETISYTDPVKAFENLSVINPDLIFLDLNMPVMNGLMFLQKMREQNLSYPVYILTSSTFQGDKDKVVPFENIKGLIVKPLSTQTLSEIVTI